MTALTRLLTRLLLAATLLLLAGLLPTATLLLLAGLAHRHPAAGPDVDYSAVVGSDSVDSDFVGSGCSLSLLLAS